jgi:S-adenosylmethionine/arginine decarboxylase-like enzyme
MFNPMHYHLLVKGSCKSPYRDVALLNDWFIRLVNSVGMAVVAGPTSVMVSEPGNEGLTGTVTLATSHSSIHIWDEKTPALFQFDIYSCKCFQLETVFDKLQEMELIEWEYLLIDRNDTMIITDQGKGKSKSWISLKDLNTLNGLNYLT